MSFLDELGLKAAAQLEESLGPYVALPSYKRLLRADPLVRGPAVLGALRCAVALGDDDEVTALAAILASCRAAPRGALTLATTLLNAGKLRGARVVAEAEDTRRPRARAAYVAARAADAAGDPGALDRWDEVARRAEAQGDDVVFARAAARFVRLALAAASARERRLPRARIAALAERAPLGGLSVADRLVLLRGRLSSASRFSRASALSALEDIARRGDDEARRYAISLSARHLDATLFRLDAIEVDRIAAALKHLPDDAKRKHALALTEGLMRAVAARGQGGALAELGRIAQASLAEGERDLPAQAFAEASRALSDEVAIPHAMWLAALAALTSGDANRASSAARWIDDAFAVTTFLPPFPLVDLALGLASAGHPEASERVLLEAQRFREPLAGPLLADARRRAAYQRLHAGDRPGALALLTEARALFAARTATP